MPSRKEILSSLPEPVSIKNVRSTIAAQNSTSKIIVLDDDPTGCQTVHGVKVLLRWDGEIIERMLNEQNAFYILHNSRSLNPEEAFDLNKSIAKSLLKYVRKEDLKIISRSDSTLRGHFKEEIDAISSESGPYDGVLVVPYFLEGGRLTIHNEHYVAQGPTLVPASETEFAGDAVFGFSTSSLPEWIEAKTNSQVKASEVLSISLEDIRIGGVEKVMQLLLTCSDQRYVVINATCDEDLDTVVLALQQVERKGKRFLIRSAASIVKVYLGLDDIPLWKPEVKGNGGVIIAGSHVKKTTDQLATLTNAHDLQHLELSIRFILNDKAYFQKISEKLDEHLRDKQTILISTERKYQLSGSDEERLIAGRKISDFLSGLINNLKTAPDFVVAKGGITSNDVARFGLEIVEAEVVGQIQPGIPVWKPGPESKFPNCTYVVFPGNVGEIDSLKKVYEILTE